MKITTQELYARIAARYPAGHGGKIHLDCPSCGKEPKKGQTHFIVDERGGHCFVCEHNVSLYQFVVDFQLIDGKRTVPIMTKRPARTVAPVAAPEWLGEADRLFASYLSHPRRFELWGAYKPLTRQTIERCGLGVGYLPKWSGLRLIVPVLRDGKLVGIHGRAIGEHEVKWATAPGSDKDMLWAEDLRRGCDLIIMENYIDALMLQEENPAFTCIALGSARKLRPGEMASVMAAQPDRVTWTLDNDLVGQANLLTRNRMVKEWEARNPGKQAHVPLFGFAGANDMLINHRLRATVYQWPNWVPPKADPGWMMAHEGSNLIGDLDLNAAF